MRSNYLVCEGRELHYTEWGAGHAETVIAWHGLARTGRDMDDIAEHLSQRYRVICPDTIGRGLSQWSPHPEREYCLAFYVKLAVSLRRPARARPFSLARHVDGRRDRHARGRRAVARSHPASRAQRQRAATRAGGDRTHPRLRRQPGGFRHGERARASTSAPSTSLTAGSATRSGAASPRPRRAACPTGA